MLLALSISQAYAEDWPQKGPIWLIVSNAAGSSADIPARILVEQLSTQLGQTIVVDNRPGAGGSIAGRMVAQSKPGGYSLLFAPTSAASISPWTLSEGMWQPDRELLPIGMFAYTPLAIAVKSDSPIRNMRHLIELAREKPDSFVSTNPGLYTRGHLASELVIERAKAPLRTIPFKSFPGELVAVMNGDAAMLMDGVSPILAQTNGQGLRILAVSSDEHLPGLESYPLLSVFCPVNSQSQDMVRIRHVGRCRCRMPIPGRRLWS